MQKESARFQFEDRIVWQYPDKGVSRQVMAYNDTIMMVKVKFETGATGTPHTHPHSQATYVVSGVFEFTTDGETRTVRTGDGVYVRPNTPHGCKCIESGLLIDTFSPMRADFL